MRDSILASEVQGKNSRASEITENPSREGFFVPKVYGCIQNIQLSIHNNLHSKNSCIYSFVYFVYIMQPLTSKEQFVLQKIKEYLSKGEKITIRALQ